MGAAAVAAADALGCARPGLGSGVDGYQVTTPVGAVGVVLSPHALRASAMPTITSIAVDRNPFTARLFPLKRTSADRANHTTAALMSVAAMVGHGARDQAADRRWRPTSTRPLLLEASAAVAAITRPA